MNTIRRHWRHAVMVAALSTIASTLEAQIAVTCAVPGGNPPSGISLSPGPQYMVVSWKKTPRATSYGVVRRNPDGTCWNITPQPTTATWVQEAMPTTAGTYDYQVSANYASGPSGFSQWTPYTVGAPPIAGGAGGGGGSGGGGGGSSAPAPTNLTATGTPSTATLTWTAVTGAVNYRVMRTLAGTTAWTLLTPTPITVTTFANDPLPDATQTYTYMVLAYQKNGQHGDATANFKAPPPTNPTGLVGSAVGSNVTLSWQPVQYASGYLVSGPGVLGGGTVRVAGTRYSFNAPDGTNVYRVGAVFDPGSVQTASSQWPSVTVQTQAIVSCACTATGPFTIPTVWQGFAGRQDSGQQSFNHPTLGTLTLMLTQQNPPYWNLLQIDVVDAQGQNVLSEGRVVYYGTSPDQRYFLVGYEITSPGAPMTMGIFRIQPGPGRWPKILDTAVWWGNAFGFASNDMFVTSRGNSTNRTYSFQAFNLLAPSPISAVLDVTETNVTPVYPQPILSSPCADRLMYMRFFGTAGQADFYRRTSFGSTQTPVLADYDATLSQTPGAYTFPSGITANHFWVVINAFKERNTGSQTIDSMQCTP